LAARELGVSPNRVLHLIHVRVRVRPTGRPRLKR
jgi:hypothetical protein